MPRLISKYVRAVDSVNRIIGRAVMLLVFAMMGILLYSSFMKAFFIPPLWGIEMAQFVMAAYYLLGGAYSMQTDSHVRMDLFYSRWSPRRKAAIDVFTILFMIFYLVLLLYGGISSAQYALQYSEESYSSWAPKMAPVKIIMVIGIVLMLLQAVATLFKDLAAARGETLS